MRGSSISPRFQQIAKSVGAYLLRRYRPYCRAHCCRDFIPNPVPYADFVTTTTHKTLRGPRGGVTMCKAEYAKGVDKLVFPGLQGGPLMHVIAAKAVAFQEALSPGFKRYQQQVLANAKALAQGLVERGYKIVSGGTDTHLMLLNLSNKGITGKDADAALDAAGIIVNKNAVPYDEKAAGRGQRYSPWNADRVDARHARARDEADRGFGRPRAATSARAGGAGGSTG